MRGNETSNQSHKRGATMKKLVIEGIVLMLVTCGGAAMSVGEQISAPRVELRIVDMHPANWASVTLHVFEHLIELDKDGKLVPRLATSWQWRDDRTLDVTCARASHSITARSSMPRSSSSIGSRIPA